ncbi:helix-turn-helix domain-containing protein [Streptomyces sp. NPDC001595]|uniref:helix-turn-helix domain-containing protein n=1 Tax=Streptomyces sp. NPDC001532 TaxID=3154520 RepID=UPI003323C922
MQKGKQITGTARQELAREMKKQYEKGMSIRAIAEAHGRSYGFVHRVLSETEVPLRSRGGERPHRRLENAGRTAK